MARAIRSEQDCLEYILEGWRRSATGRLGIVLEVASGDLLVRDARDKWLETRHALDFTHQLDRLDQLIYALGRQFNLAIERHLDLT